MLISVLLERENLFNEEKLFATILLGVLCCFYHQGAVVAGVSADPDDKITPITKSQYINQQYQKSLSSITENKKIFKLKWTAGMKNLNDCQLRSDAVKKYCCSSRTLVNQARSASNTAGTATGYTRDC